MSNNVDLRRWLEGRSYHLELVLCLLCNGSINVVPRREQLYAGQYPANMLYPAWYIIGKIRTSDDFYLHIMNIHSYILFQAYLLDFQYNLYLIHNNEMKRDLPTYQFMKSVLSVCLSVAIQFLRWWWCCPNSSPWIYSLPRHLFSCNRKSERVNDIVVE